MLRYLVLLAIRSSVAYRLCQVPTPPDMPPARSLTAARRTSPAHA
ncbi:MAG: hypothetical protein ACM32J_01435 [Rhizobacter sp.]|jgi:hypothetical protein